MSDPVDGSSGLRRKRRKLKLGKKVGTFPPNESILPDDVVMHILSWLPAKDVLRYRCVCRVWRDLTSTKDFTDSHFRHSFPLILKEDRSGQRSLLDRCWEPAVTRSKIHKLYEPKHEGMVLSQNGLVVARGGYNGPADYIIYNPVYHNNAVNIIAKQLRGGLYGVFFHPIHQEYYTLWRIVQSFTPFTCQYKILNLESNPKWRDIGNPPTQNPKFPFISSLSIGRYLYWMVDLERRLNSCFSNTIVDCNIMEYDIEKEEFRMIPCPAPITSLKRYTTNVNLVDINGVVSVVEVVINEELLEINIRTLKDDGEQLWTSSNYIINGDLKISNTPLALTRALAFHGGELIVLSDKRLYVCNLKLGTFRNFGQTYRPNTMFFSHVVSLVSLKNCKSNICVVEEDENNNKERSHGD